MVNKTLLIVLALLLGSPAAIMASVVPFLSKRKVRDLTEWKFTKGSPWKADKSEFNDENWERVQVPHTYNMDAINGVGYYQGVAWYRTQIAKGAYPASERIFIRFEGVGQEAEVYLNGKKVGSHAGGYSAFAMELTDNWDYEHSNLIAVKVDNTTNPKTIPVSNFLFNIYGGIYRPAALFSTPKACISPSYFASPGVFVETKNIRGRNAAIEVRTHVSNQGSANPQQLKVEMQAEMWWRPSSKRYR